MGSTKKPQTPAKAEGKTAAQRHHSAGSSPSPYTPTKIPGSKKKSAATPTKAWSHVPPRQEDKSKNGRHEGRNLITWTRPRMAEKLLLHIQYECSRYKIDLPWDSIAHRLHPGSSGGAILQHMNRLRNTLVAEGHLVPPICQKPGSRVSVDPTIRGYVRKHTEGLDSVTTRAVPFTEIMDDRKFNLPDAYDNVKVSGHIKRENQGGAARKTTASGSSKTTPIKAESPDPANLDGDGEYDPNPRRRSLRAKPAKSYIEEDNNYDLNDDEEGPAEDDAEMDHDDDDEAEAEADEVDDDGFEYQDELPANPDVKNEPTSPANQFVSSQESLASDSTSVAPTDSVYDHQNPFVVDHSAFMESKSHFSSPSTFFRSAVEYTMAEDHYDQDEVVPHNWDNSIDF